jgi:O-methyltransferase involved in polyketide biosynthesis
MRLPIRLPLRGGPESVSPTAHYTGQVWRRNGLSHEELGTVEGRVLFDALAPAMTVSRVLGGPTLEGLLLARHRIIDDLLAGAIDEGRITQVVEIACGMSPRGWRFAERYGDRITYVEADLPEMAARKRRALEQIGSLSERHRVTEIDALRDSGPGSLAALASTLDRRQGLAIVTEGLLTYFDAEDVLGMWRRFARELARFGSSLYLADLRLGGDGERGVTERAFRVVLSSFVRRQVHTHFEGEGAAVDALRAAGFEEVELHRADAHPAAGDAADDPAAARIHIIEARA